MNELKIKNVTKRRGYKTVLNNANVEFKSNRITAIVGLNGSGKTTLLKLIAKEISIKSGKITFDGKENYNPLSDVLYIPDKIILPKLMKISDLIDVFKEKFQCYNEQNILEVCQMLDLSLNKKIYQLSKGGQELIQLALLFAVKPKFLLLDEPLGAIDIVKREYIVKKMIDLQLSGVGIIITTHLIEQVSNLITDITFLKNGTFTKVIEVDEIYEQGYKNLYQYTQKVLNETNI